jgi:mRNA interferase MazF
VKGYPFEVALPSGVPVTGVVLADQVKSLNWKARQCAHVFTISEQIVVQVLQRLDALLGLKAKP